MLLHKQHRSRPQRAVHAQASCTVNSPESPCHGASSTHLYGVCEGQLPQARRVTVDDVKRQIVRPACHELKHGLHVHGRDGRELA